MDKFGLEKFAVDKMAFFNVMSDTKDTVIQIDNLQTSRTKKGRKNYKYKL